jgi:hypothetical protein
MTGQMPPPEKEERVPCPGRFPISTSCLAFERSSKRRKSFPSETRVKRGDRLVHGDVELIEQDPLLNRRLRLWRDQISMKCWQVRWWCSQLPASAPRRTYDLGLKVVGAFGAIIAA